MWMIFASCIRVSVFFPFLVFYYSLFSLKFVSRNTSRLIIQRNPDSSFALLCTKWPSFRYHHYIVLHIFSNPLIRFSLSLTPDDESPSPSQSSHTIHKPYPQHLHAYDAVDLIVSSSFPSLAILFLYFSKLFLFLTITTFQPYDSSVAHGRWWVQNCTWTKRSLSSALR